MAFELCYLLCLGILVLDRLVRDEAGLGRVRQCRQVLFDLSIAWIQARQHQSVTVATQRLTQQTRQFGVAIRNISLLAIRPFSQRSNDLSQGEQTLVNVDGLLGGNVAGL